MTFMPHSLKISRDGIIMSSSDFVTFWDRWHGSLFMKAMFESGVTTTSTTSNDSMCEAYRSPFLHSQVSLTLLPVWIEENEVDMPSSSRNMLFSSRKTKYLPSSMRYSFSFMVNFPFR